MSLKAFARQFTNRLAWVPKSLTDREFPIGNQTIIVPRGHRLDLYCKDFPLYNQQIRIIASVINKTVNDFYAIDIGANIGDTAAYITADSNAKVLCVEGNPHYLQILEENSRRLSTQVVIERAFVGEKGLVVDANKARNVGGTSTVTAAIASASLNSHQIPMLTLEEILTKHPNFQKAKLLKTDTDGYDFKILSQSISTLEVMKPVIFLEYDPRFSKDSGESIACIEQLLRIGYTNFLAFDNYGCASHLLRDISDFMFLNKYLKSCEKTLEGPIFFDLCCGHRDDSQLFSKIVSELLH